MSFGSVIRFAQSPDTTLAYGIGGKGGVIWHVGNSAKKFYELSIVDFSTVRASGALLGGMSGIGGAAAVIWHANSSTDQIYEISTADFSIVRQAAGPSTTSLGAGGDYVTLWHSDNSAGVKRVYELSTTDFSVIRSALSPGTTTTSDIGGDANTIWHLGVVSTTRRVYELSVATFAVIRYATTPGTSGVGIGGDTYNLWHANDGSGTANRVYELDPDPTTPPTISVHTYDPSEIEANTVKGEGYAEIVAPGAITQIGFQWGTVSGVYPFNNITAYDSEYGDYSKQMTGLSPGTVYYYRAAVYHSVYGWLYGEEISFTTLPEVPSVSTFSPSCPTGNTLTANGEITSIGGATPDLRGFVWDLASHDKPDYDVAPGDSDYPLYVEEEGSFGTGAFTGTIPDVVERRTYYIRAYAHNSEGYAYGNEIKILYNSTMNILRPTGAGAESGIRFSTGKPSGMGKYYRLLDDDSYFFMPPSGWGFGSFVGNYIYEMQYYAPGYRRDLYALANPCKRDEGVIKIKWKAHILDNLYPSSTYKRALRTYSTVYEGSVHDPTATSSYVCEIFYTNPNTGNAWTIAELDALQAGISLNGGSGFGRIGLDQLEVRVLWANADVRTDQAQELSSTQMRLKGFVLEDEGEAAQVYFEWGLTTGYGNETTPQDATYSQYISDDISGLDAMETYHYRAVIVTACGETFYGSDVPFNMERPDRIYVWLGEEAEDEQIELTDPDYPMALAARTERGWDEELAQASAGIAEVICDNFYGDFNPENVGGAYYGDLALGKWLTIYEQYKGVKYPHFTGKIQKILPNDDPNDPTAYILAVDGMDDITATKVSTVLRQDTDVGELADDALDACNWPAGARDIDAGVDTLEFGWFHKRPGLDAFRALETTEKGRFFIKRDGDARFENRHYRITGSGLISQATFQDTAVRIQYEWSKRLLYNDIQVTGRRYTAGGVQLFSGYDLAALDAGLVWSAHTGDAAAPYIPQSSTVTLWAEFGSPISSYDALVEGTHWNANTSPDKSGDDVGANINITITQYGQALKLVIENTGSMGAYLVEPDSPPDPSETEDRTLLIYGVLFGSENVTVIEEDQTSQDDYGKRTLEVDAPFKSRPNDILAYAQWLKARYHLPIPNPVQVIHVARTNWPEDTIRIQCLVREISDRITVASTKLGFDRDFYINKVIQEYAMNEGGMVHDTTWVVEQAEGSAEGLYWLLGVAGFGELGEATILGF